MSLMKYVTLAAIALSASSAVAGDIRDQGLVGTWRPVTAETLYTDWTVLVFSGAGRFAALVASRPAGGRPDDTLPLPVSASELSRKGAAEFASLDELDAASGSWILGEDGGEVVLTFDNLSTKEAPGSTRYLKMLLLGDALTAYPGMEDRSPIAATPWRRIPEANGSGDGVSQ